jgi:GMP reductase
MDKSYAYDDVALVPEFYTGTSRSNIDTSCSLGRYKFKVPVVPANMKCVVDATIAKTLQQNGYFYVMHRFMEKGVLQKWIMENQHLKTISISIGVVG